MTHLQKVRLSKREAQTAQWIGTPYVLAAKILIKVLWKMKRWLMIFALAAFVMYGSSTISVLANSPKGNFTQPITVSPTPTSEQQQIIDYIRLRFGQYADNALRVATCESGLNPRALNDNTQWGGVGIDRGIFQLNSVYQRIDNPNFLFDYRSNIDMAWVIFSNAGYNWHLWTCGRKLGL